MSPFRKSAASLTTRIAKPMRRLGIVSDGLTMNYRPYAPRSLDGKHLIFDDIAKFHYGSGLVHLHCMQ